MPNLYLFFWLFIAHCTMRDAKEEETTQMSCYRDQRLFDFSALCTRRCPFCCLSFSLALSRSISEPQKTTTRKSIIFSPLKSQPHIFLLLLLLSARARLFLLLLLSSLLGSFASRVDFFECSVLIANLRCERSAGALV